MREPAIEASETQEVTANCEHKKQGARNFAPEVDEPDERYDVWRIAQVVSAGTVVELVRLKPSTAYERYLHKNSNSKIQVTRGEGHLILEEGEFIPYQPGDILRIPKGRPHGFFTMTRLSSFPSTIPQ